MLYENLLTSQIQISISNSEKNGITVEEIQNERGKNCKC